MGSPWTITGSVRCEVSLLHPYTSAGIYGLYISHERNIGGVAQIQYEQNSQGVSSVEGNKFPNQTNFSALVLILGMEIDFCLTNIINWKHGFSIP